HRGLPDRRDDQIQLLQRGGDEVCWASQLRVGLFDERNSDRVQEQRRVGVGLPILRHLHWPHGRGAHRANSLGHGLQDHHRDADRLQHYGLGAGLAHYLRPRSPYWRRQRHRADDERLVPYARGVSTQLRDRPDGRVPGLIQRDGGSGGHVGQQVRGSPGRYGNDGPDQNQFRNAENTGSADTGGAAENSGRDRRTGVERLLAAADIQYHDDRVGRARAAKSATLPRQFDWNQRRLHRNQLKRQLQLRARRSGQLSRGGSRFKLPERIRGHLLARSAVDYADQRT